MAATDTETLSDDFVDVKQRVEQIEQHILYDSSVSPFKRLLRKIEDQRVLQGIFQTYTHNYVTDYTKNICYATTDKDVLRCAKRHTQRGQNVNGFNRYYHRASEAPTHGASVSLIAAKTAGHLMNTMDAAEWFDKQYGIKPSTNKEQAAINGFVQRHRTDSHESKAIETISQYWTELWCVANIQSKLNVCPTECESYLNTLKQSVQNTITKTTAGTDLKLIYDFAKNIAVNAPIKPIQLCVWGHLLHHIAMSFAQGMKGAMGMCLDDDCEPTSEECGMLGVLYLIVLWTGFIKTNLVDIGQGQADDKLSELPESGEYGVIFKHTLDGAVHKNIVELSSVHYAQQISTIMGVKCYDWKTIKTLAPQLSFGFVFSEPPISFYDKGDRDNIRRMSFSDITDAVFLPEHDLKPSKLTERSGTIRSSAFAFDEPEPIDGIDDTASLSSCSSGSSSTLTVESVTSSKVQGEQYVYDDFVEDEHGNIQIIERRTRGVLHNAKVWSHRQERQCEIGSSGNDGGIDGISLIDKNGKCASSSLCDDAESSDSFCAIVYCCTIRCDQHKCEEDLRKMLYRIGEHVEKTTHIFADHLPKALHQCRIGKIHLVTILPDNDTLLSVMKYNVRELIRYLTFAMTCTSRHVRSCSELCEVTHMFYTFDKSEFCTEKALLQKIQKEEHLKHCSSELCKLKPSLAHTTNAFDGMGHVLNMIKSTKCQNKNSNTNRSRGFLFEGYFLGLLNGSVPKYIIDQALSTASSERPWKRRRAV